MKKIAFLMIVGFALLAAPLHSVASAETGLLPTVAEASDYKATATHAEVMAFIRALQARSPHLRVETIARTTEGRDVPLLVLGKPLPASPEALRGDPRLVVYIQANIHAGEVEGKEASLALARDILLDPALPYLDKLVILIAPNFNPDGNDKISPNNRRNQNGPEKGVGVRHNGQGLDLNRDGVKLESPEMRGLVENVLRRWDPALVVDCHTTNGAYYEEPVTYAWQINPNSDPELREYMWRTMLPAVGRRLEETYGFLSIFYGDPRDPADLGKGWEIYSHQPRYLTNYVGLRNRLAILNENYVYADYKTRVLGCAGLLRSILDYCRDHADDIRGLVEGADARAAERWKSAEPADQFHTAFDLKPLPEKVVIRGYEVEVTPREGTWPLIKRTDRKKTYVAEYFADVVPTKSIPFPWGYLLPSPDPDVLAKLRQHGVAMTKLAEPFTAEVEAFRITELKPAERLFQGHWMTLAKGERFKETREFPAGTVFVGTAQPLGSLAAVLLEPESDDGFLVWNFFDRQLVPQWGRGFMPFPVYRVLAPIALSTEPLNTKTGSRLHFPLF